MTNGHPSLKLGKGSSFVKTHLKQLEQATDTWEADFRAMPTTEGQTETHYLGLVVAIPKDPLAIIPVEYTPNVNDLADLLASALRRPTTGFSHRPQRILFRDNPRWEELFPHLTQLGIEVSIQNELPHLEEVYVGFLRQMRKIRGNPIILTHTKPLDVGTAFPAIARFVQDCGHIEIGDQDGVGFIVRALDYGGMVFEDSKPRTLTEAMAALERGLDQWFLER